MRQIIKNNPLSLLIVLLGIGILVASILLYALQPHMGWRSDVIIGVLMAVSIWAMFNVPFRNVIAENKRSKNHLE